MVDYVGLQATTARLIKANGVPVTLTKKGVAIDYDPGSGTVETGAPSSFGGYAVREEPSDYQVKEATDSRQQVESLGVMLSFDSPLATLALGDQMTMDGKAWRIYGYTPCAPGPVTVYYKAGLTLI